MRERDSVYIDKSETEKKIRQSSEREVSMHDYESETRVEPNKLYLYIRKKDI